MYLGRSCSIWNGMSPQGLQEIRANGRSVGLGEIVVHTASENERVAASPDY